MNPRLTRRGLLQMGAAPAILTGIAPRARAAAAKTRFTKYEVFPTRIPMVDRVREAWIESYKLQGTFQTHYTPVFIRLYTDDGLTGVGESLVSPAQTDAIAKRLIGKSPIDFWQDDSLQGVLMAVHDVMAQAAGTSIARLLSPAPKPRIEHTWWTHCLPPALMASEAKLAASLGYRVHKVKARPWQDPLEQAAAMCAVVPKEYRIWADANAHWGSPDRALHFIKGLAKHHNYFAVESPVQYRNVDSFRALKGKSPLKIAEHMGEDPMVFVREGLLQAFVIGGPLGRTMAKRALMAEVTGVPLWVEYGIQSGISQVYQAHQAAAYPGIEYCITVNNCLEDDFMKETFKVEAGYYTVPTTPGLGVTLDMDAVEKYRVK
ncbi:MAG: mandelate racemase/muconate lactonizing enzyme family protein [Bryobacterales bacterium]|nr:mandelate racemase/muconate lactonizing enzyme family protein [Bryobacterales bacterium]